MTKTSTRRRWALLLVAATAAVALLAPACGDGGSQSEPDTLLDTSTDTAVDANDDTATADVEPDSGPAEDTLVDDTGSPQDVVDTADTEPDTAQPPEDTVEPPFNCYEACLGVGDLLNECLGDFLQDTERAGRLLPPGWQAAGTSLALRVDDDVSLDQALATITEAAGPSAKLTLSRTERLVLVDEGLVIPSTRRERLRELGAVTGELLTARLPGGQRVVVLPRLAVSLDPAVPQREVDAMLTRLAMQRVDRLELGTHTWDIVELDDPSADVFLAMARLKLESGVDRVAPDLLRTYVGHNDPLLAEQWHLGAADHPIALPSADIQVEEAWEVDTGSPDTVIAVFDDGVDARHPDLADTIVPGIAVPDDLDAAIGGGCCLHGTSVAGVAAARGFNGVGGRGVCPECSVMPIFVEFGALSDVEVASKLAAAVDMGAAVINNSWGYVGGDPAVDESNPLLPPPLAPIVADALDHAERNGRGGKGTVVVWAAGNYNGDVSADPYNAVPTVISVAAHDDQNRKSWYSDWGQQVWVAAPSSGGFTSGIVTTVPPSLASQYGDYFEGPLGDRYTKSFGGTSSATPTVSGLVGLLLSLDPELTAAEVRQILRDTADPIDRYFGRYDAGTGHSLVYGHGAINAYRAVLAALPDGDPRCAARPEVCNGVDDDCDGEVDPNCATAGWCAPCAFDAACASGVCARTPGDTTEHCLAACSDDMGCGKGATCHEGLCVPDDGRCAPCAERELCNGVDDDCDGEVDEAACPLTTTGRCQYDAQCQPGAVCAVGRCRRTCQVGSDCGDGDECLAMTDRYGDTNGTRLCVVSEGVRICDEYICQTGYTDRAKRRVFECFEKNDFTCGGMLACWLQFP